MRRRDVASLRSPRETFSGIDTYRSHGTFAFAQNLTNFNCQFKPMNKFLSRTIIAVATLFPAFSISSCDKADTTDKYEIWYVHDYCVAQQQGVQCYQNDYDSVLICCKDAGKHFEGEKSIVSQDASIIYYREFEKLIRKYDQ